MRPAIAFLVAVSGVRVVFASLGGGMHTAIGAGWAETHEDFRAWGDGIALDS
jgi:hypothetical protein